jgi:hypothetical protein
MAQESHQITKERPSSPISNLNNGKLLDPCTDIQLGFIEKHRATEDFEPQTASACLQSPTYPHEKIEQVEEEGFKSDGLMDHEEQEEDAEDEFSEMSNGDIE